MMGLAAHLGRQPAQDILYAACREAVHEGVSLAAVLLCRPEVTAHRTQRRSNASSTPRTTAARRRRWWIGRCACRHLRAGPEAPLRLAHASGHQAFARIQLDVGLQSLALRHQLAW